MISGGRNFKEIERKKNREEIGAKTEQKQRKNRALRNFEGWTKPLRNQHYAAKPFHNTLESSARIFAVAKASLAHECHFAAQEHLFRSCETHCEVVKPDFAPKILFRKVFCNCKSDFGTRVPLRNTVTLISQLRNALRSGKAWFRTKSPIPQGVSKLRSRFWHTSAISQHSEPHFAVAKWLRNPKKNFFFFFHFFFFRNQSSISQGISKLRNHFLAHKCHLEASYTHFAAAKWLQNLHTLKSFSTHTMNRHVITAPPFRQLLDTIWSLPGAQIMHAISRFKSWEVKSP